MAARISSLLSPSFKGNSGTFTNQVHILIYTEWELAKTRSMLPHSPNTLQPFCIRYPADIHTFHLLGSTSKEHSRMDIMSVSRESRKSYPYHFASFEGKFTRRLSQPCAIIDDGNIEARLPACNTCCRYFLLMGLHRFLY